MKGFDTTDRYNVLKTLRAEHIARADRARRIERAERRETIQAIREARMGYVNIQAGA